MNQSLLTWLLAGALATSIAWNLRGSVDSDTGSDCGSCRTGAQDCSAALASLDLTDEQRRALDEWSRSACRADERAAADRAARDLCALLAAPELDVERARALADEAGRMRAAALRACVDSVVAVRGVLTPDQAAKLLGACCAPDRAGGECAPVPAGPKWEKVGYTR